MTFQVMPGICDDIIMDEEWMWQMLLNLLTNACKYTDRGSILLLVSVVSPVSDSSISMDYSDCGLVSSVSTPDYQNYRLLFEVYDTG